MLSASRTRISKAAPTVVTDKNNLLLNYGNSASDLRHRFTFSPSYAIPGMKSPGQMLEGWSVSSIVVLQSGAVVESNRFLT